MNVANILRYASRWHPEQLVVSRNVEGGTTISNYRDLHYRTQLLTLALQAIGVKEGSFVASMAWNTQRHMEVWYGVMGGCGGVLHTLNPRLSDKDLIFIINDAGDAVLTVDLTFVALLARLLPHCPCVRTVIVMTDRLHMPAGNPLPVSMLCYEELLAAQVPHLSSFKWADVPETAACGMCYTSGTTGNPKGVLYSHRSNFLHALVCLQNDCLPLSCSSSCLAVVPMFHANSWGLVFTAPLVGAKLVLPGPFLDGESIYSVIEEHGVTVCAAVPTVFLSLLAAMEVGGGKRRFSTFKMVAIGGAAPPRSMIETLEVRHGVEVRHIWGMTELSPLGTQAGIKPSLAARSTPGELLDIKARQGRPHALCDLRIVDDQLRELPRDGQAVGNLEARGPAVVRRYWKQEEDATSADGWFSTGDVATIDLHGTMTITDRSKDVIKSGGEWISSIEIENLAMAHPRVLEAAVVGIPDEKWGERPLLVVVKKPGASTSGDQAADNAALKEQLLVFLEGKIARHCRRVLHGTPFPSDVVFVDEIPHNATGKVYKLALRATYAKHRSSPRVSTPKARL
ncbi:MAG: hypothetical protein WDW38_008429 [Sanguina aurantia]